MILSLGLIKTLLFIPMCIVFQVKNILSLNLERFVQVHVFFFMEYIFKTHKKWVIAYFVRRTQGSLPDMLTGDSVV